MGDSSWPIVPRRHSLSDGFYSAGHGQQEILLRIMEYKTGGDWRWARLFLLTRDGHQPVLRIIKRYEPPWD